MYPPLEVREREREKERERRIYSDILYDKYYLWYILLFHWLVKPFAFNLERLELCQQSLASGLVRLTSWHDSQWWWWRQKIFNSSIERLCCREKNSFVLRELTFWCEKYKNSFSISRKHEIGFHSYSNASPWHLLSAELFI